MLKRNGLGQSVLGTSQKKSGLCGRDCNNNTHIHSHKEYTARAQLADSEENGSLRRSDNDRVSNWPPLVEITY